MAKEISYARVSTKLGNVFAQHKSDNCVAVWQREFKETLNNSESRRLFELFSGELHLLEARADAPQLCSWTEKANPENWTKTWVESLFNDYTIQSKYGPHMTSDGHMANPRKPKKPAEAPVEIDPLDVQIAKVDAKMAKLQEEKEALLTRKEEKRRREEALIELQIICEDSKVTMERLVELVCLTNNII